MLKLQRTRLATSLPEESGSADGALLFCSRFPLDDFNAGKEVLEAYLILSPEGELLSYGEGRPRRRMRDLRLGSVTRP